MRRTLMVLLVAAAILALLVGTNATRAQGTQRVHIPLTLREHRRHRIAYTCSYDGQDEVCAINNDGTGLARLTTEGGSSPVWSPDGRKLAFLSARSGVKQLYVMMADGADQRQLTLTPEAKWAPRWSPRGDQVAYLAGEVIDRRAYVISADGSSFRRLADVRAEGVCWSPDGQKVLLTLVGDTPTVRSVPSIYLANADGSGRIDLTSQSDIDYGPEWSPDGTRIYFTSQRDANDSEVYVMQADGSGQTRLTFSQDSDRAASVSPDGTMVAFVSLRDGNSQVYRMRADGSEQTPLTSVDGNAWGMAWAPGGREVAYTVTPPSSSSQIWIAGADGRGKRLLTPDGGWGAVWQP